MWLKICPHELNSTSQLNPVADGQVYQDFGRLGALPLIHIFPVEKDSKKEEDLLHSLAFALSWSPRCFILLVGQKANCETRLTR
jgi:hypothetical protein